jgi:hypothetical protein
MLMSMLSDFLGHLQNDAAVLDPPADLGATCKEPGRLSAFALRRVAGSVLTRQLMSEAKRRSLPMRS